MGLYHPRSASQDASGSTRPSWTGTIPESDDLSRRWESRRECRCCLPPRSCSPRGRRGLEQFTGHPPSDARSPPSVGENKVASPHLPPLPRRAGKQRGSPGHPGVRGLRRAATPDPAPPDGGTGSSSAAHAAGGGPTERRHRRGGRAAAGRAWRSGAGRGSIATAAAFARVPAGSA